MLASFEDVTAVAVGPDGSVYISDGHARLVRRVTPDGLIHAFAGSGASSYSGDGGPASNAGMVETNKLSRGISLGKTALQGDAGQREPLTDDSANSPCHANRRQSRSGHASEFSVNYHLCNVLANDTKASC